MVEWKISRGEAERNLPLNHALTYLEHLTSWQDKLYQLLRILNALKYVFFTRVLHYPLENITAWPDKSSFHIQHETRKTSFNKYVVSLITYKQYAQYYW